MQETQSRLPAANQLSSADWLLHYPLLPASPGRHSLSGLAAVTKVSLCFIKVNNMSEQYTVSQYIGVLVNVDVKTILKF